MREVRVPAGLPDNTQASITNSQTSRPACNTLTPHLVIRATVGGPVDPRAGYVVNASVIDRALREAVVPVLQRRVGGDGAGFMGSARMMRWLWRATTERLGGLRLDELELCVAPHLRLALFAGDLSMVLLTQQFEFAAAHRLCVPDFSDEENRRIFGKCSNPTGHGHNYVLEVTVAGEPDPVNGTIIDPPVFEAVVKERVIERFDHKHLNIDCPEFERLNPTVENLACVIWGLLRDSFEHCRLHAVRVWENTRTFAEYRGE